MWYTLGNKKYTQDLVAKSHMKYHLRSINKSCTTVLKQAKKSDGHYINMVGGFKNTSKRRPKVENMCARAHSIDRQTFHFDCFLFTCSFIYLTASFFNWASFIV